MLIKKKQKMVGPYILSPNNNQIESAKQNTNVFCFIKQKNILYQKALKSELALKKLKKKAIGVDRNQKLFKYKTKRFFNWVLRGRAVTQLKKKPLEMFMRRFLKQNKKELQLYILLKGFKGSSKPVTDIQLSLNSITELLNNLNYFCTKNFKKKAYFKTDKYYNYLDISTLASPSFNKFFLVNLTTNNKNSNLVCNSQKQEENIFLDTLQQDFLFCFDGRLVQNNNYSNRYFYKWCVTFANHCSVNKQITKPLGSNKLFTVVRSPFVFKKTREQYHSQKVTYSILVKLQNPMQKVFLTQSLGLLRLLCELEILNS